MPILHTGAIPRHRMINSILLTLGLGFSLTLLAAEGQAPGETTLAVTTQGSVRGTLEDGLRVFKGIPYAQAPTGEWRWQPPRPPAHWQGVRDATSFGPGCPTIDGSKSQQGQSLKDGGADLFIGVPLAPGTGEDCLYLNVWTPAGADNAAVMVWLQPTGPSSMPLFDGSAFARDGVVFVSLDYRQLSMGNFAHPALTAEADAAQPLARFQTMDQLAALRWVKQNIAAFGGDASNVTVFGQSAGAASVLQLLTLPAAKGLIDKAIVQSGVGWWSPMSLSQMERLGSAMASYAGLPGKLASAAQLRALPAEALPQLGVYSVDGRLQAGNATDAIAAGQLADVPLLIGWTDFDGSSLRHTTPEAIAAAASPALLAAYASDQLSGAELGYQLYTDSHVSAPARWIARMAQHGAPSYLYQYSHVLSLQQGKARGASHGSEIPFVFDIWSKALPQLPLNDADRKVTKLMHSCWISFAQSGVPHCDGAPAWPAYTEHADQLMELDDTPQLLQHYRKTQFDAQEQAWRENAAAEAQHVEDAVQRFEALLQDDAIADAH